MIASNHLILCHPLLLLPSIFPSIRVFSNDSALHITWPKDWSFNFSISSSNEYSGLTSFRIDWFDFLAVQGTVTSLLCTTIQSNSSSALSLLYGPALTSVNDYWKNHSFDYTYTFVGKVMCLLFDMLSRFVIALLPSSKQLLISPSTVILEPKKIKSVIVYTFSSFQFSSVQLLSHVQLFETP